MTGPFDFADLYAIAFGYRDIPREADLLLTWFDRHHGGDPATVLELAAGPGDHALELAKRGLDATALDLSAAMCAKVGEGVRVVQADMTDFELDQRFDLAILMLDSASLLLTGTAMTKFLGCVGRHLTTGGLLVLDLSVGEGKPDWTIEAGGRTVRTQWGLPGDAFDPRTGIEQTRVRMTVDGIVCVDEVVGSHPWTAGQVQDLAGDGWELVARYGSMTEDIPASDLRALRDVLVLRGR
ncbi:class I SAM-dependent DNA methyltransferase [Paractinoplanes lichenicola]|uniref:Class I SAM-dependent methyltransferase n=1 Tax=Paractinoplanes lichenicola TaxID=2802976 RepID=A0ABS1VZ08_9ACTN|nr:class I SAM-dependent methyltransferase [Actinoplanes lichenicola]MBL7259729.1 class I SAM-dependent methyltransferase [Actinoplanes lichenicola]